MAYSVVRGATLESTPLVPRRPTIRLFQTYLSPFPTRVRLVLYAKGLDAEIIEPSGFHQDSGPKGDYLDVNPIGRVPALVLDDGRALPESEVICEYLEDVYPEPSLRPDDPFERAQVRLLSRISDIYIVMAMVPLFSIVAKPPHEWDQKIVRRALREIAEALESLEEFIGSEGYAVGRALSHADGTLAPILLLVDEWLPIFRPSQPLLDAVPKTRAYWQAIQRDPIVTRVLDETRTALRKSMGREG